MVTAMMEFGRDARRKPTPGPASRYPGAYRDAQHVLCAGRIDTLDITNSLRAEHTRIRRMLDVFASELSVFEGVGQPDYELIGTSIDYCLGYLDVCHHPKEDALLACLHASRPDLAAGLDDLGEQHHDLAAAVRHLKQVFDSVSSGGEWGREFLAREARELIRSYRDHLDWEESTLYPIVERELSAAACTTVERTFAHVADPLAAPSVERHYAALYAAVCDDPSVPLPA